MGPLFFLLEYTLMSREHRTSHTLAIFLRDRPSIRKSPSGDAAVSPGLLDIRLEDFLGVELSDNWLEKAL